MIKWKTIVTSFKATEVLNENYSSGLENWLSEDVADQFLMSISIPREPPSIEFLTRLIRACYAQIPFQNLTMLTRPRVAPSREEIVSDMLSKTGGLCTTNNPFFCALLHQLGFNTGLISASMKEPDCHIGLIVAFYDDLYWVDLGNGFPYLTPLLITQGSQASHVGFNYELTLNGSTVSVNQTILGTNDKKKNQCFIIKPVHYSYFNTMRIRHYQEENYGHFLKNIRINCWTLNQGFVLRDNIIWTLPGKARKGNSIEILSWIRENFRVNRILSRYRKSVEVLNDSDN